MSFSESQTSWLALYFVFNLGLTLYNKRVLVQFPFPYTLTALHALCGSLGGFALEKQGIFDTQQYNLLQRALLFTFSILYTVNIAVSNLSLGLVTVPFHQVVRAGTPIFTLIISFALFQHRYSTAKCLSLFPVMLGVGLATYGDYYFTAWGLALTLLGTFLAALKTVVTNVLQSPNTMQLSQPSEKLSPRLRIHPLDLLSRMSPLAFIQCVLLAYLTGELDRVQRFSAHQMSHYTAWALLVNGIFAFGLNIVSFTANRNVGALSMTVAANVKQVLTITIAVYLFDLNITFVNMIGIGLTLVGGFLYASVEHLEKGRKPSVKNR